MLLPLVDSYLILCPSCPTWLSLPSKRYAEACAAVVQPSGREPGQRGVVGGEAVVEGYVEAELAAVEGVYLGAHLGREEEASRVELCLHVGNVEIAFGVFGSQLQGYVGGEEGIGRSPTVTPGQAEGQLVEPVALFGVGSVAGIG